MMLNLPIVKTNIFFSSWLGSACRVCCLLLLLILFIHYFISTEIFNHEFVESTVVATILLSLLAAILNSLFFKRIGRIAFDGDIISIEAQKPKSFPTNELEVVGVKKIDRNLYLLSIDSEIFKIKANKIDIAQIEQFCNRHKVIFTRYRFFDKPVPAAHIS